MRKVCYSFAACFVHPFLACGVLLGVAVVIFSKALVEFTGFETGFELTSRDASRQYCAMRPKSERRGEVLAQMRFLKKLRRQSKVDIPFMFRSSITTSSCFPLLSFALPPCVGLPLILLLTPLRISLVPSVEWVRSIMSPRYRFLRFVACLQGCIFQMRRCMVFRSCSITWPLRMHCLCVVAG